ncbi:MAG: M20/M25/M40 family metallo-hydrolase [Bacteroidetes bacterium]|nr:M20/M25/M40 family metallo-hydrolase [Bacteroidota bacterium]
MDQFEQQISRLKPDFEKKLQEFVEIPSVSLLPERAPDMHRAAEYGKTLLEEAGFKAEIVKTKGYPVIWGRHIVDPAYPTLSIYNHLDVQPGGEPEWKTDPFRFVKQGDTYFGRGTTDDKGPALSAYFASKLAIAGKIPLNLQFLWELEEEIGSPSYEEFITKKRKDLQTDSVLVSDTIWLNRERPAIPYGLRGLQAFRLTLETGEKDCHSGLCGGAARNPLTELAQLISELVDGKTGKVKIPGFYQSVKRASKKEIANFVAAGFDQEKFKKAHGLKTLRFSDVADLTARIWALPTLEVHGITGGWQGPGVKTAIPPRAEAKISCRLVPDQTPEEITDLMIRTVKKLNPDVQVHIEGGLVPYLGEFKGKYADAGVLALEYAFGATPAFTREGGSIGAVVTMKKLLGVPVNFLGLSLPEHGYHAPNENFDWRQASGGMKMFLRYFELISGRK